MHDSHSGLRFVRRQLPESPSSTLVMAPAATTIVNAVIATDASSILPFTKGLKGVNLDMNKIFVYSLVMSFLFLAVLVFLVRWAKIARAHLRQLVTMQADTQHQRYWMYNHSGWWSGIKKHLLYAPIWRHRHNNEIRLSDAVSMGTLPTRFHSLLLILYCLSNIAYCVVLDYSNMNRAAVVAELRGRTGRLATVNLVPTIIFALRNNPLIPLLQVSYDTFNLFHRWTARIVVIETVAHTLAWAENAYQAGGLDEVNKMLANSTSYQWGMAASCVFVAMSLQAWSPMRHAFYETFLNVHKIFAMLGIAGVWVHLEKHGLPSLPWAKAVVAIWAGELGLRMCWLLYYNVRRRRCTKVLVEALPNEACRVTLDLATTWRFKPGCHVHIYLPAISQHSSHPFSLAWAADRLTTSSKDIELEKMGTSIDKTNVETTVTEIEENGRSRTSISLVCRARTGMTRKMYNRAVAAPQRSITLYGAMEGPYGGHESLDSYGTVLLFAGGVGITHQIGYIRHLLQGYERGTVSTRKVVFVWSVPNVESLEWVRPWMDEILHMSCRREVLKVLLFVTKPRTPTKSSAAPEPSRCSPADVSQRRSSTKRSSSGWARWPSPSADLVASRTRSERQLERGSRSEPWISSRRLSLIDDVDRERMIGTPPTFEDLVAAHLLQFSAVHSGYIHRSSIYRASRQDG